MYSYWVSSALRCLFYNSWGQHSSKVAVILWISKVSTSRVAPWIASLLLGTGSGRCTDPRLTSHDPRCSCCVPAAIIERRYQLDLDGTGRLRGRGLSLRGKAGSRKAGIYGPFYVLIFIMVGFWRPIKTTRRTAHLFSLGLPNTEPLAVGHLPNCCKSNNKQERSVSKTNTTKVYRKRGPFNYSA